MYKFKKRSASDMITIISHYPQICTVNNINPTRLMDKLHDFIKIYYIYCIFIVAN